MAVAEATHAESQGAEDSGSRPAKWIKELEVFFVNYHALEGKEYQLLGCKGASVAFQLLRNTRRKK